jgi:hypothetical protein
MSKLHVAVMLWSALAAFPPLVLRCLTGTVLTGVQLLGTSAFGASTPALTVEGTEFVVTLPDGRQRRSRDLAGAELQMPDGSLLRIDAVERDMLTDGSDIWLHALSVRTNAGWEPLCALDSSGRSLGFPFPGTFTESGRYRFQKGLFSLSCTIGAQAKCIRIGYAPWKMTRDGTSLVKHYDACIRMIRADYCGDREAHTVNGTIIDIYDDIGIQKKDEASSEMRFEAGWGPDGAVCISHVRIPGLPDPRQVSPSCSALKQQPGGQACNEEWARKHGAILFNRSK